MPKYTLLFFACALLLCHLSEAKKVKEKPKEPVAPHQHTQQSAKESPPEQKHLHEHNGDNNHGENQRLVKPKSLKVLSEYEKCKMDCKRQRDKESAHEYVERLREELRIAEEQLAHRDDRVIEL